MHIKNLTALVLLAPATAFAGAYAIPNENARDIALAALQGDIRCPWICTSFAGRNQLGAVHVVDGLMRNNERSHDRRSR